MKQNDYIVAAVLILVCCLCAQTTTLVFAQFFAPDVSTVRFSVSPTKYTELIINLFVFFLDMKI